MTEVKLSDFENGIVPGVEYGRQEVVALIPEIEALIASGAIKTDDPKPNVVYSFWFIPKAPPVIEKQREMF